MTDITALQAEKKSLLAEIAALQADVGRQMPGRKLPSPASSKVSTLQLKLNTVNMKIKKAEKASAEG